MDITVDTMEKQKEYFHTKKYNYYWVAPPLMQLDIYLKRYFVEQPRMENLHISTGKHEWLLIHLKSELIDRSKWNMYHSSTFQPIQEEELDYDSEEWQNL